MARYYSLIKCCVKYMSVNEPVHFMGKLVGMNKDEMELECEGCKKIHVLPSPKVTKRALSYPHYNDSIGQVVDSRSHEEKLAKDMGLRRKE